MKTLQETLVAVIANNPEPKTTADFLRQRRNPSKTKLLAGVVYSGDNGRLMCVQCAGYSAKYSGRDLSGHKVTPLGQSDADEWMQIMGKAMACEVGCTKHLPSAGVTFDPVKRAAMFGEGV